MRAEVRPTFLLSLPRSGSTLLQRILGAHSRVATVAEPWFLLPPLYALREVGVYSEYGHQTAAKAVSGLLQHLPRGEGDYLGGVADMARSIYRKLSPPDTQLFVDKTPRYGLVVEDLLKAFPDGEFIILHRNPLATVASIVSSFDSGKWKPYRHKVDLFLLSERLIDAQQKHPDRFHVVRYEDLITDRETTVRRLVTGLGLDWEPEILTSFSRVSVEGEVGDKIGTTAYTSLSSEPLSKWPDSLGSPVRKAWVRRYLRWLGVERLNLMGYDQQELLASLDRAPVDYSSVPMDLLLSGKGLFWSVAEVEAARDKLERLSNWKYIFTHS